MSLSIKFGLSYLVYSHSVIKVSTGGQNGGLSKDDDYDILTFELHAMPCLATLS